jgi:PemK-like, MazF-like toxin of type II toxin-antitoxin system
MKRGDVVVVALPGDFGKPRPALIIQSDLFNETHPHPYRSAVDERDQEHAAVPHHRRAVTDQRP